MKKDFNSSDIPKGFPFQGTMEEFKKLFITIDNLTDKLETSDNPREIIFESWFIFDYYIRRMLLKGLNIEDLENEKLDLMYDLLPQSFDSCLRIFEKLLINQRDIYSNKKHPNTYFKRDENTISFNGTFIAYLMNEKSEMFTDFMSEYWNYLERTEPEYIKQYNSWDYSEHNIYKVVPKYWIEKCTSIDDEWFSSVKRLNKCRNKAAHLYDDSNIYSVFGINGNDKFRQLKRLIVELIEKTLNVEIKYVS